MRLRTIGVSLVALCVALVALTHITHPSVRGRCIVVYSQWDTPFSYDACFNGQSFPIGFGSCKQGLFNEIMGIVAALAYAEDHGASGVRVALDDGWWDDYFEQPYAGNAPMVHFNTVYQVVGKYRSFNNYYFDGNFPCASVRPSLQDARRIVQSHIRLIPSVKRDLDAYADEHFAGRHVIGVHYRGTDKILVSGQRPLKEYLRVAGALRRPNSWVYVASDTDGVVGAFEKAFPGRVMSTAMYRAPVGSTQPIDRSGHGRVRDAVMDMLRLSRCNIIIKGRSSLSDVSVLMSPSVPFIYI